MQMPPREHDPGKARGLYGVSLRKVAGRMAQPLPAAVEVPTWIQAGSTALALIAGGGILGVSFSPATGVALALALLFLLAVVAAVRIQGELSSRDSDAPNVKIGVPATKAAAVEFKDGRPATWAAFVTVPISNHPQDGALVGIAAEEVHAQIRVLPDGDGTPDSGWLPARWVQAPQQVERGQYASSQDAEVAEMRLPANGRQYSLDAVAQLEGNSFCGIWNQEAYWEIGVGWEFKVEMAIQGSNLPRRTFLLRITPEDIDETGNPLGIPRAQLVA